MVDVILTAVGVSIAFNIYLLNSRSRQDRIAQSLRDAHLLFWSDEYCEVVRSWVACDESYEEVRHILSKRNSNGAITKKEYESLEKIDKYCAMLAASKKLEPKGSDHSEISYRLIESFWINEITEEKRPELKAYICEHFEELGLSA